MSANAVSDGCYFCIKSKNNITVFKSIKSIRIKNIPDGYNGYIPEWAIYPIFANGIVYMLRHDYLTMEQSNGYFVIKIKKEKGDFYLYLNQSAKLRMMRMIPLKRKENNEDIPIPCLNIRTVAR